LGFGLDPRSLDQAGMQDPSDLGWHLCQTQATWDKHPFLARSYLGLEGDVTPKLTITITIIIYFTLQIKSMFFFDSNNIYFKFNNINNNIKLV